MSESSDDGAISASASPSPPKILKRQRETTDNEAEEEEEEGLLVVERPSAPIHPSQQHTSPYDTSSFAASPANIAVDTPDPDYQGNERQSDRVFTGCSSIENYTLDIKVASFL